jgi:hypothetical protein
MFREARREGRFGCECKWRLIAQTAQMATSSGSRETRLGRHEVLSSFEAHQILLVEWEDNLLRRLGYPAVTSVNISTGLILTPSTVGI